MTKRDVLLMCALDQFWHRFGVDLGVIWGAIWGYLGEKKQKLEGFPWEGFWEGSWEGF